MREIEIAFRSRAKFSRAERIIEDCCATEGLGLQSKGVLGKVFRVCPLAFSKKTLTAARLR